MTVGGLSGIRKNIQEKKNNKNYDHKIIGVHTFIVYHFISYVILYILVKLINPNSIPFCVQLFSDPISIGN